MGFKLSNHGSFEFGKDVKIFENVIIGVAKNASLKLGSNNLFNKNIVIKIANQSNLTTEENVTFGNDTVLLVKGNWKINRNTSISNGCSIYSREKDHQGDIIIGEGTNIGDNTLIDVSNDIIIGNNVAVGPGCKIYTHDHDYSDLTKPAWKGIIKIGPIEIQENSWIGANVILMPNIVIGKHAVIAAGSVVTKSVPENEVYGGVPARFIKRING